IVIDDQNAFHKAHFRRVFTANGKESSSARLQRFTPFDALFTTKRPCSCSYVGKFEDQNRAGRNNVKARITTIVSVVAVALALFAGFAIAEEGQGDGSQMHHGMMMHHGFMGEGMGLPLHQLNLTDDQKTQIHQIMKNEHANIKPLMQQEFQAHQQMIQLVTSGSFDQQKAAAIAAQESQTHVALEVEHAKIASQVYALLSSDQKAKVADMIAKHQQRMQEHLQKQNNGEEAPAQQQ